MGPEWLGAGSVQPDHTVSDPGSAPTGRGCPRGGTRLAGIQVGLDGDLGLAWGHPAQGAQGAGPSCPGDVLGHWLAPWQTHWERSRSGFGREDRAHFLLGVAGCRVAGAGAALAGPRGVGPRLQLRHSPPLPSSKEPSQKLTLTSEPHSPRAVQGPLSLPGWACGQAGAAAHVGKEGPGQGPEHAPSQESG